MPEDMTSILNMLYPSREPSPYALQSLFGFGPRESFDLLRSMKLFPTEAAGAEEKLKAAKIANMLSEIGIPAQKAGVEAFVGAPKALQYLGFGKEPTPKGVAFYQDPTLAVGEEKAGIGLTEAQAKHALAQAGLTTAQAESIMRDIREAGPYGGPSTMKTVLDALKGTGTGALKYLQEGQGFNVPGIAAMPKSPEEQLKEAAVREALKPGGNMALAKTLMELSQPGLAALGKTEAAATTTQGKIALNEDREIVHYPDPFFPGKTLSGLAKDIIPLYASRKAKKQVETEKTKKGSTVYILIQKYPKMTDQQLEDAIKAAETETIQKDRANKQSQPQAQ